MLSLHDRGPRLCDRLTRREVLRAGGFDRPWVVRSPTCCARRAAASVAGEPARAKIVSSCSCWAGRPRLDVGPQAGCPAAERHGAEFGFRSNQPSAESRPPGASGLGSTSSAGGPAQQEQDDTTLGPRRFRPQLSGRPPRAAGRGATTQGRSAAGAAFAACQAVAQPRPAACRLNMGSLAETGTKLRTKRFRSAEQVRQRLSSVNARAAAQAVGDPA